MNSKIIIKKDVEKREVAIERMLDGTQELVWRCLTTPEYIDQWWGPDGWATETLRMDVRPGGIWHYRMYGDGLEVWGLVEYDAVEQPNRIAYREAASNAAGQKQNDKQQHVFISLNPQHDAQTNISILTRFASVADMEAMLHMGMAEGYGGALDKLEAVIKSVTNKE